ncbi:MAG: tetratricopeptide repeat protein [Armatimonadota bacterium]|nr:tetratricopeptide repeat protein [Armatimonadota bacterium]
MMQRTSRERRHLFSYLVCILVVGGLVVATVALKPWDQESRQWLQRVGQFVRPGTFARRLRVTGLLQDALSAVERGDWVQAEQKARQAIKVSPDNATGWEILVLSLSQQGRWSDAEEAIQQAPTTAIQSFLYGALADLSYFQGQPNQAIRFYQEALKRDPDNPVVLNNYGYLLAERGERLDEAEEMIKKALKKRPNEPAFLDSLGWVYYQKGDYQRALPHIEKSVQRDPNSADVRKQLGMVYYRLGDLNKARRELEESLRIDPSYQQARKALDEVLEAQKQKEMTGQTIGT